MKRLIALLISAAFIFGVSCSNSNENTSDNQTSAIDYSTMEVVRVENDRIIYDSIEDLEANSDLIVIGTFVEDTKTEYKYGYTAGIEQQVMINATSTNIISIDKVIIGDAKVSDTITVAQRYGIEESSGNLITFSDLTPMRKGDQWIFFLSYGESTGYYWCTSDYSSRFPVPSGQSATLSRSVNANTEAQLVSEIEKMTHEDFGVYSDVAPMKDLYYDVITHYDCTLQ